MTISKPRKQDRAITFFTQEELQRLFSAIDKYPLRSTHPTDRLYKKRDRAIFAVAYRHGLRILGSSWPIPKRIVSWLL